MRKEFLRIRNGIKKGDDGEKLRDLEMVAYEGEITLVLAGRILEMECLSNLLSGRDSLSYGTVYYRGEKVSPLRAMELLKREVVCLGENSGLVEGLSIADNLFVLNGRNIWQEHFFAQDRRNNQKLVQLLEEFEIAIKPYQKVAALGQLQRYQIRLLKLFKAGTRIVLLDQRLMHLTELEKQMLYQLIHKLRDRGVTFIVLDYTPPEELQRVDSILVVRQAATCFTCDTARMNSGQSDALMQALQPRRQRNMYPPCSNDSPVVLSLRDVNAVRFRHLSLELHAGEVAFIESRSYETECMLYDMLCGRVLPTSGEIYIAGKRSKAMTCEQRTREGVIGIDRVMAETSEFYNLTVFDNYCMRKGQRVRELWWRQAYKRHIKRTLNLMFGRNIADDWLYTLSPSELQCLQFAACMLAHPKVFICLNPFTNVDMDTGQKAEALIQNIAQIGIGVLVLSHGHRYDSTGGAAQYLLDEQGMIRIN